MALEKLKELCQLNGLPLNSNQIEKFESYRELLKKWGKRINITSILTDREIEEKHFFDSLLGIKAFKSYGFDYHNKRFGDVGSGGGFPGIPLAIAIKTSTFDLIESRHKRCIFLEQVKRELKLTNVNVLCSRVESVNKNYNMLLMRAVKEPTEAVKLTEHLLNGGATLCIFRGRDKFYQKIRGYETREASLEPRGVNLKRNFLFIFSRREDPFQSPHTK